MIANKINQVNVFPVSAQRLAPLLLAGLLSACGGGGSGGESGDGGNGNAGGAVSSVTPASGATDVARNTTVTATFNEDVLGTSVDGTSFTLSAADSVSGSVSFDGLNNIATFTPDSDLALMANYTATLTSSITDLSGDSLGDDYSWSFTTADGNWGTANMVDTGDTLADTNRPSVAHLRNGDGDTLVAFRKVDGGVWVNRYAEGSGWGAPVKIGNGSVDFVHIAADNQGNAIVVWRKTDGNKINLWSNRYVSGSGWEGAERIRYSNGSHHPRIAFDGSGNATLVWYESDDTRYNIWGMRYEAGTGWTGAQKLESEDFGNARDPEVAVNDDGRAVVVWQQFNGARWNIWGKFYIPGKGWFSAVEIEDLSEQDLHPKVAIDSSGYAIAVWEHSGSAGHRIFASRFDPGQGWGAATAIESNTGQTSNSAVAMDSEGNAAVVWAQQDSDGEYDLWTNRYEIGSGWGTAELLEYRANKLEVIAGFNLAFDAQGNAIATWIQANGSRNSVNARRYIKGSGWGDTDLIEGSTGDIWADSAQGHRSLAIDSQGRATAVWSQSGSSHVGIKVNRFK